MLKKFGLWLMLCLPMALVAQEDLILESSDSTEIESSVVKEQRKSPGRASLLSAVCPGAGQFYNGKYWKLPIVYAGIGTSIYFILDNRKEYREFRGAYLNDLDTANTLSTYGLQGITTDQLRAAADQYRLWMEWSYIATGVIYVLQIVDAAVDAHLYHFDVSDDLSINWRPEVFATRTTRMATGLSISLNF